MHYTASCKHSLVLLRMGEIIGRNYRPKQVELIEIINKPLLLHLVGYLYNYIRDAWSQKHPIWQSDILWHYYELTLFSTLVR